MEIILLAISLTVGMVLVVLLVNAKVRTATLNVLSGIVLLGCVVIVAVLSVHIVRSLVFLPERQLPVGINAYPAIAQHEDVSPSKPTAVETGQPSLSVKENESSSVDATMDPKPTVNREEEIARAITTNALGMLKSISVAIGRVLAEEEKNAAGSTAKLTAGAKESVDKIERPEWVGAPPRTVEGVYRTSVVIGPYTSRAECDAKISEVLQEALDHYIRACLGSEPAGRIRLTDEQLRSELVRDQWEEVKQYSVGPMIQLHLLLEFDRKIKEQVIDAQRQSVVAARLQWVAGSTGLALALLGVAFAYLRIDLATGGAYRGRLRLAAAVVILVLAVAVLAAVA